MQIRTPDPLVGRSAPTGIAIVKLQNRVTIVAGFTVMNLIPDYLFTRLEMNPLLFNQCLFRSQHGVDLKKSKPLDGSVTRLD